MHKQLVAPWMRSLVAAAALVTLGVADTEAKKDKKSKKDKKADAVEPAGEIAPGLVRHPYLQSLGGDSVLVVWDATAAGEPAVDFGSTPDYGRTALATSDGTRRVAVLRRLERGSTIHYRVRAGAQVLAGGDACRFRTDGGPSQDQFSFFVTGDIGDKDGQQHVTGASILRATPRPELGLIVGDVIYGDGSSRRYDRQLMRPWAPLLATMPVWPALGNHDWKTDPQTNFCREWYLPNNEHYYSFDYGTAHFIALDTRDDEIYDLEAQLRWFEDDLRRHADADWLFVYFHHPGITCTYKGHTRAVVDHLLPIIDRYDVDVVFTGHAHTYERLYPIAGGKPVDVDQDPHYRDPQGTIFLVSGAGAKVKENRPTRACGPTAFFRDETVLWTHVQVQGPTCTIRSYRSADDALVDEVTISKSRRRAERRR